MGKRAVKKEIICVDLDNTLIRSNKTHVIAYNKAFAKHDLPKVAEKVLKDKFGRVGRVILKELFPQISRKEIEKIVDEHHKYIIQETYKYAKVIPGAKETIKKLRKTYKIALTTNCSMRIVSALLKGAKIDRKLFHVVIGQDKVRHPKPAADELKLAAKRLQSKVRYMIGDTIYDVQAGKKAKATCISVLTGNQSRKQLAKERPWKIVKSIKDVEKLISTHS